ncbi:MAG: Nif-specific regulatory protein [Hyphomicrobiaceae bacterium]|jgi:Nif-specific regulatory protein
MHDHAKQPMTATETSELFYTQGASHPRLQAERVLYRGLLQLGSHAEIAPFLEASLDLIADATGAQEIYLEVAVAGNGGLRREWALSRGLSSSQVEDVQGLVSRGIVTEALASGKTIRTRSAMLDPRFQERESVQLAQIDNVICAPIGQEPALGCLYLHRRGDGRAFDENDRELAELLGRHLAPLVHRITGEETREADARGRQLRAQMGCPELIGNSAEMLRCLEQVAQAASVDTPVFLRGETGTGKTELARILHVNSARANRPLITFRCSESDRVALDDLLLGAVESTGENERSREDRLREADGGTVVFEEIGALSPAAQSVVADFLESGVFRAGGTSLPLRVNLRVIATSSIDLEPAVVEDRFRKDLLYRLGTSALAVPALVARNGDVDALLDYFLAAACARHKIPTLLVSGGARAALRSSEWPGNLRELDGVVKGAVIRALADQHSILATSDFFPNDGEVSGDETFQGLTQIYQRRIVLHALEDSNWNVTAAARRLDIARSHIYTLINTMGIKRGADS